ncbi:hypothetical protein [Streptomyces sp. NPDC002889]|uniref:hypothetical protein n=1 Tax=Streptomyces sp. NPDC002889 TaxID=3364669 RepID=UPI00369D6E9F
MTHSGQGDEQQIPAARPAHEGVVLPADGSEPWVSGASGAPGAPGAAGAQAAPAGGQPWGDPWGPPQQQPQPYHQAPYAQPPQQAQAESYAQQHSQAQSYAQPPQQTHGYGYPAQPAQGAPAHTQPAPVPPADSDATQYIPPVAAAAPAVRTADVHPGALPPETPAESTHFLGTRPLHSAHAAQPAAPGGDADATQYIAPVPGGAVPPTPPGAPFGIRPGTPGDRQPPAEFDSLFRTDGAADQFPDSTQQMPRIDAGRSAPPGYQQQAAYQQPSARQPAYQEPPYDPEPGPRRRSTAPVVAALVIGCAVLGLGLSAVMFGGDDEKDPDPGAKVAAGSQDPSASSGPSEAPADPAEPQAEALDKLLADSNSSRAAVIRSVENIKACENLDQAATDLRGAAAQRRSLVTRLEGLTVDKLPNHPALTAALTKAWQASASADDHYATWAQQAKGKKGCKGGQARQTGQTAQANRASGEATKAKNEASGLWNTIARKYDLTERRSDQL